MPKTKYALELGGPLRVEVHTRGFGGGTTVLFDGAPLGTIESRQAFREGRTFPLPDGTQLTVQMCNTFMPEVRLSRNGAPLPGSGANPKQRVKQAAVGLYIICGFTVVLSAAAMAFQIHLLLARDLGMISLGVGVGFGALGYLTSRGSVSALIIGTALFSLDTLVSLPDMFASVSGRPNVGGLVMRVMIFMMLFRGIPAALKLNREPAPPAQAPPPPAGPPGALPPG